MAYTKQTWADLPSKTTPINATRLGHIEDGIFNAAATADTAASTAGTAAANIGIVSGRVETLTDRVNGLDTAVSNKVDKVTGKGLSTNDYNNTDKGKVDSLGTASTKNSTSVVTQSTDLVESGAVCRAIGIDFKNLLPLTVSAIKAKNTEGSWNGDVYTFKKCTYTLVRVDNSEYIAKIVVNGQATGGNSLFYLPLVDLSNGSYLGSSGIAYSTNSAFMQARAVDGTTNYYNFNADGVEITNRTIDQIYCAVMNGNSASNVSLYPMIRKATVSDPTYEPYHASVEQTLRDAEVIEGKNLLNITMAKLKVNNSAYTWSGDVLSHNGASISFIESDGFVTGIAISGTVTSAFNVRLTDTGNIGYQGKILNGTVDANKEYVYAYDEVASQAVDDVGNGITIPDTFTRYRIVLNVKAGAHNNEVIYPMISKDGGKYEPYYIPLKDVVPNKADNSVIGTVEGANASKAWSVGEHFIKDGQFKEVTQPIASGGAINGSNTVDKPIADCLVYKAGDSIEVGDGTYPTMYNGIFFSNNTALRFVIRVDKKIIANNVAISNSGIGICNADGTVASVSNLTANYNILILNIKNNDIQVQISKKDGTAFSVTDGSTAVVRFYGTLTFS